MSPSLKNQSTGFYRQVREGFGCKVSLQAVYTLAIQQSIKNLTFKPHLTQYTLGHIFTVTGFIRLFVIYFYFYY